jgi:uncharacterized delta-60 repeat protein
MTAPVLEPSFSPSLGSIFENSFSPGITIAALIADGSVTDTDGAVEAIAVEALDTRLGTWQYSLDGGTNWLTIQANLLNSTTNTLALLLGPTDMLRLLPFGDLNGTLAAVLTFRAWDMSTGSAGDYVVSTPGTGAFSSASDTASLVVTPVNDAPTFAPVVGTGKLLTDIGSGTFDLGRSVTVQADGRIVVAGTSYNGGFNIDSAVLRYNTDGSLDSSFGVGGKLVIDIGSVTSATGYSASLQADGKIVVATSSSNGIGIDFAVLRYNTDGSLDTSFGVGGKLVTDIGGRFDDAHSVTLQADGKIVVAGEIYNGIDFDFAVVRYNTDGSLDTSFNGTGKLVTDIGSDSFDGGRSVTVQADGKIVVAGSSNDGTSNDFAVLRYNNDGSLDNSFNGTGKLVTDLGSGTSDFCRSVTLQADGKIVVAGSSFNGISSDFAVLRYNTDGSLDTSFNGSGKLVTDIGGSTSEGGTSVTVQADGKIVVAGFSYNGISDDFAVLRYNTDGSLDTSFNGTGKLVTDIGSDSFDGGRSVTVQADGKIVVAGESYNGISRDFAVLRYNTDGSLDTSFNGLATNTLGGTVAYTENATAVALDSSVAIFDADLAALASGAGNYDGASITLARSGAADAQDLFSALGQLTLTGVSGDAVLSGITVGSFTNSGGTLVITFNSSATQARVNEVLSRLAYANSSDAPPASVQFDWSFSDGNSGAQGAGPALLAAGSTTVNITAVNDPAVIGGTDTQNLTETDAVLTTAGTLTISDPDSANSFVAQTNVAGSGAFGHFSMGTDGVWTYTTDTAHNEFVDGTTYTDTLTVSSADGATHVLTVNILGTDEVVVTPLFTNGDDLVNFNSVVSGGYTAGTQYDALGGNDVVTLAGTLAAAATAGYDSTLAFHGGAGNDTITGGGLNDTIYGDANNDTLIGAAGNDALNGGKGNDTYRFGVADGNDTIVDSRGKDAIVMTDASNALNVARSGKNLVINVGTLITVAGHFKGDAVETLQFAAGSTAYGYALGTGPYNLDTNLTGRSGNDIIASTGSGQTLDGGNGNDLMFGNGGNDRVSGGSGNDLLVGGAGNDKLNGGAGADTFGYTVGDGADTIRGGSGADRLVIGGSVADDSLTVRVSCGAITQMAGGSVNSVENVSLDLLAGADTLSYAGTSQAVTVNLATGTATGFTSIAGVENVLGGTGNDHLTGDGNANSLTGGSGKDTLAGGLGNDVLDGGRGADTFLFDTTAGAGNVDTILNFSTANDTIRLDQSFYSALSTGTLATSDFQTGTAALDATDRIIFDSGTGALLYDADGTGATSAVQFATLIGVTGTLTAADFFIVA